MQDFEKNRTEYVMHLETQIKALQDQLLEAKKAEPYLPKVSSQMGADTTAGAARITMSFGGKNLTLELMYADLVMASSTDITSAIVDNLHTNITADVFKSFIRPEIEKLQQSAKALGGAGKW